MKLSALPLIEFVEQRGGPSAVGFGAGSLRAFHRAQSTGEITVNGADRLATALRIHPAELWGAAWDPDDESENDVRDKVECATCGRTIAAAQMTNHMRAMHSDSGSGGQDAVARALPEDDFAWEEPPKGGRRSIGDELAPRIAQLKEQPNRWARLRIFPQGRTSGATAAKKLKEQYPDCEFRGGKRGEGSAVWGRYVDDLL